MKITNKLLTLKDEKFKEFNAKLIPNVDKKTIIGIKVPILRKIAKEYIDDKECVKFLNTLPHKYYDEYMLHGLLISEIKDYNLCIKFLDKFLPYVDNWAVCDITSPKVFKKNTDKLIDVIYKWINSKDVYKCRFGIGMLMSYYLDEHYKKEYLKLPASIKSEEYYINMMIAWFYATALAKRWDDTIKYLEKNKLDIWVHNKTIKKACESNRISKEQKEYLKTLKR